MDAKLLILYEHRDLLESLGYNIEMPIIDLVAKTDEGYRKSNIKYGEKSVGTIGLEERNLYYLYRDERFVGNRDLSTINFNKNKRKNIRTLVHLRLFHNDLKINCFNMLHSIGKSDSEDRTFICISDCKNVMISKYLNNNSIDIYSLKEEVSDDSIIEDLRKKKNNKTLSYKLGDELNEYKN